MTANIQIISIPTSLTDSAVAINLDNASFLINVGESTQRLSQQNKFRIVKLRAIFLSKINWNCIGGLPGLLLTASETQQQKLCLNGPQPLVHFLSANRKFLWRPEMKIQVNEVVESGKACYEDDLLSVIPIIPLDQGNVKKFSATSRKRRKLLSQMFRIEDTIDGSSSSDYEEDKSLSLGPNVSYLFERNPLPGKMNGKRATELGVIGADRKKLIAGESVISKYGLVVNPSDCVEPQKPGSRILYASVDSVKQAESFLENQIIKSVSGSSNPPKCIIHASSLAVLNSESYKRWIIESNEQTKHFLLAPGLHNSNHTFYTSDGLLEILAKFKTGMFPSPASSLDPTVDLHELTNDRVIVAKNDTVLQFEPNVAPKTAYVNELSVELEDSTETVIEELTEQLEQNTITHDDDRYVLALGTGSCIPSLFRNVSSTAVKINGGYVLLDAGEGTLAQLYRHYGNLDLFFNELKLIFISHIHADHHLGTFKVIQEWFKTYKNNEKMQSSPLTIIAPSDYLKWMNDYSIIEDIGLGSINQIASSEVTGTNPTKKYKNFVAAAGLKSIQTVEVEHCYQSYGIVFEDMDGFKVTFSGDCRPNAKLIEVGQKSDLLIHEATFDEDQREEAVRRKHTTVAEAISVGTKMNANNVLLTHFSQRFHILPPKVCQPETGPIIGFAFDLLKIKIAEFWKFKFVTEALQKSIKAQ